MKAVRRVPECFRIEYELIKLADDQAYDESSSRASIYRKALIEYLKKNGKEMKFNRGRVIA